MRAGRSAPTALGNRLSGLSIRGGNRAYAVLFLIPTAALFVLLIGYPVVYSLVLMFSGRSATVGGIGPFVGLGNWAKLASDPLFLQAALQTLMYVVPSVLIGLPVGLGVALVLNERFPGRGIAPAARQVPRGRAPGRRACCGQREPGCTTRSRTPGTRT